ncbi:MAG: ABC transporter ATP-binding protein [Thermodesulfobacteriota bacterium]
MIRLENVSFTYPSRNPPLFQEFHLDIDEPSWVALTGPEGAGKTTLGKLIHGMLKPNLGTVSLGTSEALPGSVGYLGGDPYDCLVGVSVEEEIIFGLENLALPRTEMAQRLGAALRATGLEGMESRLTHTLSGGEQQKLALASMLAMDSRVLILDEAMTMIDRPTRSAIRGLLRRLASSRSLTVLEITNSLEDSLTADRILFLDKGVIRFDGVPAEFARSVAGSEWFSLAPA